MYVVDNIFIHCIQFLGSLKKSKVVSLWKRQTEVLYPKIYYANNYNFEVFGSSSF